MTEEEAEKICSSLKGHGLTKTQVVALVEAIGATVWFEGLRHHASFPTSHPSYRQSLPGEHADLPGDAHHTAATEDQSEAHQGWLPDSRTDASLARSSVVVPGRIGSSVVARPQPDSGSRVATVTRSGCSATSAIGTNAIPAGRDLVYSQWVTHRMPSLFPDPAAHGRAIGVWVACFMGGIAFAFDPYQVGSYAEGATSVFVGV